MHDLHSMLWFRYNGRQWLYDRKMPLTYPEYVMNILFTMLRCCNAETILKGKYVAVVV